MDKVVEINPEKVKEIKLRKFELGDLPKLSKILFKMELKDTVKRFFAAPDKAKDKSKLQEELGADLVASAVTNLWMAEVEMFDLIAGLTGKSMEEVTHLDIDELLELFTKFANSATSVVSFFKLAAK